MRRFSTYDARRRLVFPIRSFRFVAVVVVMRLARGKQAADSSNRPSNENVFLPDSRVFAWTFDVASHCSD